jgi:dTDP-4-dehydrorhamnose reductase
MKIFLTGKYGQLGSTLIEDLKKSHLIYATDHDTLDLRKKYLIKDELYRIKPDLIINTAAYTNVNKAEYERELAYRLNALAPKYLSESANILDIPIIHISTDYIFDGLKKEPYLEDDTPNPLSFYGHTKWLGEEFVRRVPKHFILRTSWIFSSNGFNFLNQILKLAQEKTFLNVVNDQWGAPTSVRVLIEAIQKIIINLNQEKASELYGTYHLASKGETSWYLYARKILETLEFLEEKSSLNKNYLFPISSSQYFQAAKRPLNSRLNSEKFKKKFKVEFPWWEDEVQDMVFKIIRKQ